MKRFFAVMIALSTSMTAFAGSVTTLNGDAARALFAALIQADLKNSQLTGPTDPKRPELGEGVIDQKVSLTKLNCKTAYTGVGIETGSCTAIDQNGKAVRLGSAAAAQLMRALPDGFGDGSLGKFTGEASAIKCEVDARKFDSTGTAIATCTVQ